MPAKTPPKQHGPRIVVLNDSPSVLKMLCTWFEQHGHHCDTALLADMPQAHEEVGKFIQKHRPATLWSMTLECPTRAAGTCWR